MDQDQQGICRQCGLYDFSYRKWLGWENFEPMTIEANRLLCGQRIGCQSCSLLVAAIEAWRPGWLTRENDTEVVLEWLEAQLSVKVWPDTEAEKELLLNRHKDSVIDPTGQDAFVARGEVVSDTRTQAASDRIALWLSDCVANHPLCAVASIVTETKALRTENPRVPSPPDSSTGPCAFMPRRVLDLGSSDNDDDSRVRLVQDLSVSAPYAALSYCWGSDLAGVVMTTRATLQVHTQEGIATASLPQTIQDAIQVCRQLTRGTDKSHCRLRYLWVDALCIVQDDAADWQTEAATMRDVYRSSHITLMARSAASCQDGFLGPQMLGQPDRQIVLEWMTARNVTAKMILYVEDKDSLAMETRRQPLETRGWTLQEAVLPRRLVHFTGNEMFWECQTTWTSESEGGYVHIFGKDLAGWLVKTAVQQALPQSLSSADWQYLRQQDNVRRLAYLARTLPRSGWMRLVEQYSQRQLTRLSDKLVAIDGLAQAVGMVGIEGYAGGGDIACDHNEAYVCGLFRKYLAEQLLWSVDVNIFGTDRDTNTNTGAGTRSSLLAAPSWSWASVQAAVQFREMNKTRYNAVMAVDGTETCTISREGDGGTTMTATSTALLVTGYTVPVVLRSALWSSKPAPKEISSPTDRRKGRISIVRPAGGVAFEVSCDDTMTAEELRPDHPGFSCWAGTFIRDTYDCWRQLARLQQATERGETSLALEIANAIPPAAGCQFPIDRGDNSSQPRWCKACRVPSQDSTGRGSCCCLLMTRYTENAKEVNCYLVLRRSLRLDGAWERVGIGKLRRGPEVEAEDTLFHGQKLTSLRII